MEARLNAPPTLDMQGGRAMLQEARAKRLNRGDTLVVDLAGTERMDSGGGAWLIQLADLAHRQGGALRWENQRGQVEEFMELVAPTLEPKPGTKKPPRSLFESVGRVTLNAWGEGKQFFTLILDGLYWTLLAPLEGKGFRTNLMIEELDAMGVRAVRIVVLMNFLLGLIIAMLSAKQVESFGLQIYVADLIMIAFARELGAIMTAVVVSARTGAAIAAEIATMKVQEEVDALRGLGLNVVQYIVAPRVAALLIALPCLTALGMGAGVLGGAVWGYLVLGFEPSVWANQTLNAATFSDIFQGMLKSFIFAIAIAIIGCHNGLRVSGGSRGVGLMTTRAVVQDIFMLIVIDIIFATIFYYVLD